MKSYQFRTRFYLILICNLLALVTTARGQEQQSDDVVRIKSELVQTEVTVIDKQGRFVDGLRAEQFELRVDGKPQPIGFFERVVAGSEKERQLAAARSNPNSEPDKTLPGTSYRGRTIIFFIDDLHLSLQSVGRTRQMMQNFIEKEMSPNDQVAFASASGQIGFLQQFTDHKSVLRAAAARLKHHSVVVQSYGVGLAPMTEYMAYTIETRADDKVFNFYVEDCMKQGGSSKAGTRGLGALRQTCEIQVKNNARAILMQSANVIDSTYDSLESLMRSSQRLPGRKLVFFVSDGFLLDTGSRSVNPLRKLQRITDAALRAGAVIYTVDARGLFSGALDATGSVPFDVNGRLESASLREQTAYQDAINALASDTGGRALRNQNSFDGWVEQALDETSNYYLLAWRPETEAQKDEKFRKVEVIVSGRPDLTVRLPRGYLGGAKVAVTPVAASTEGKTSKSGNVKTPESEIRQALTDFFPKDSLPTMLSLSYLNTPSNGMVLTSSMQVALSLDANSKQDSEVDIAGVVLNDKGKIAASFNNRLSVKPLSGDLSEPENSKVFYNHRAPLAPGIYQVRVAAREEKSGHVGSAIQWVEIPDLSTRRLSMSSLLLGAQVLEKGKQAVETAAPQIQFSVDRRFSRTSPLEFWVFIYNAARSGSGGTPDITAQTQVLRDGQPVINSPLRKVPVEAGTDMARIPYKGDVAIKSLSAGRYELRFNVTDNVAQTAVSESIPFIIE